ncbi:Multiple EGF-like-domain protein 3 precursor [Minicystis rosea]|nr:Multiple EGF-like-domain protein 3 precursor [Minicystis rosea]
MWSVVALGVLAGCGGGNGPGTGGSGGGGGATSSSSSSSGTGGAGPACGDGKVDAGEACDDGNTTDGDGCAKDCTIEKGYTCTGETSSVCTTTCGDGTTAGDETCDDGNTTAGDGCSASCETEQGFSCAGEPSVCTPGCGDGKIVGSEACDDSNMADADGCSAACAIEDGWSCDGAPSICAPVFGDGKIVGSEECDDGNTTDGDGCSATSTKEPGWSCDGAPSVCITTCGDGIKAGTETCDDGNATDGDGCSGTACTIEDGWLCDGAPSICATTCGDGIKAGLEVCDDGNANAGDGCDASCTTVENGWTCTGVGPGSCTTTCGDGIVAGAEICDDGNAIAGDGCDATCATVENGWTCMGAAPTVCATICGDGIVAGAETCDDANKAAGDGCDATCVLEDGWSCTGTTCAPICGDGKLKGTETCDDANKAAGDGCDATCKTEVGWTCSGTGPGSCVSICGDGITVGSETCDDGATTPGDGCDATCHTENGYACSGAPSVCGPVCGDGIKTGGEKCDDGNLVSGDCCSATCQVEAGCEIESNDTFATANDFSAISAGNKIKGTINPTADLDVFTVTVPAGKIGMVTAQTFELSGGPTCASLDLDSYLTVYDADGNSVGEDDDGGDGFCSLITAGDLVPGTYYVEVSRSTAGDPTFPYLLQIDVALAVCGNGIREASENCDDGNTVNGDGCSSTCKYEQVHETEPNDTCGATANGPVALPPNALLAGTSASTSDHDWFAITIPNYADLQLQTFDADGPGYCDTIDTEVRLYNSSCTALGAADDQGGINSCSLLDPTLPTQAFMRHLAPGTYYVEVFPYPFTSTTPFDYTVLATLTALCGNGITEGSEQCDGTPGCGTDCILAQVCGNGLLQAGEQCDDGNTTSGDGCSATCQFETLSEAEPNGTIAQADTALPIITADARIAGAITPNGDLDTFKFTVATQGVVRFEVFDSSGADCVGLTATALTLLSSTGTQLKTDAPDTVAGGIGSCAALLVDLAPADYYIQVKKSASGTIAAYQLQIKYETNNGAKVEPNGTISTATPVVGKDFFVYGEHQTGADVDVYEITIPPGLPRSLRAEVVEGDASETCESFGIDTYLTLYTASGVSLVVDDDDGRGFCSAIDGTGATPRDSGASKLLPGKYYLELQRSPDYSTPGDIFNYKLAITIR